MYVFWVMLEGAEGGTYTHLIIAALLNVFRLKTSITWTIHANRRQISNKREHENTGGTSYDGHENTSDTIYDANTHTGTNYDAHCSRSSVIYVCKYVYRVRGWLVCRPTSWRPQCDLIGLPGASSIACGVRLGNTTRGVQRVVCGARRAASNV